MPVSTLPKRYPCEGVTNYSLWKMNVYLSDNLSWIVTTVGSFVDLDVTKKSLMGESRDRTFVCYVVHFLVFRISSLFGLR
jgi:hypothetical protein